MQKQFKCDDPSQPQKIKTFKDDEDLKQLAKKYGESSLEVKINPLKKILIYLEDRSINLNFSFKEKITLKEKTSFKKRITICCCEVPGCDFGPMITKEVDV